MKPGLLISAKGWDVENWERRMRALLPGRRILAADRSGVFDGPDAALAEVRYLLAWKPRQDVLDRLTGLKVIFSLGAGVDHIFALDRLPDVPIVRIVDGDLTARMTEYVVWQALHHLRRSGDYVRQQAARIWRDLEQPTADAVTVGIMGFGVLGSDAAEVLRRIGFKVRGWARSPRAAPGVEMFHGRAGLPPFLGGTDILVVLLPLTHETRGIVDRALIGKLRRDGPLGGPILINAGRGGTHVEADVIEALRNGTLKAASLDVFEQEPLPADSPLWAMENVFITPHAAAYSNADALTGSVAEQIRAFERGEPLKNLVSRELGY